MLLMAGTMLAQQVTVTIQGRVADATGALVPGALVTAVNTETKITRTATSNESGDYVLQQLPVGDYTVTADKSGFRKEAKKVHLEIGASARLDFALAVGTVSQEVTVQDVGEAAEPTRTTVSEVIDQQKIENLPVNGRQFIDFALLAPGVQVGETTSGSTDVIIEPVTKLSFAGQNIHYNFIAIDGADNISTASGVQKTTPSQEAVREFRVINTQYSVEAGRAVGGIVNIVTKSGSNQHHGSAYEYFRNKTLDAKNPLSSPGLDALKQNQYGFTLGGPIRKDRTFYFMNYEGQRHTESPIYNSVILGNIDLINQIKATNFFSQTSGAAGTLATENLNVPRHIDYDNGLIRVDHSFNEKQNLFLRYFVNDQRATNLSPLNDGFDLPSGYKDNFFRDQSLVANLSSTLSSKVVNELRFQYAHRTFDFPTDTTQPHLEVGNTFTIGVNRGNPDLYKEDRSEFVDNVTWVQNRHTISFGGDFNYVRTKESFPLFYPFEADFACLTGCAYSLEAGSPFVIFFQRFDKASGFAEPSLNTAVYQGRRISQAVRDQSTGQINHTYAGLYVQDKWRATDKLTMNIGLRWQGETFPSQVLNNQFKNFDPRFGFAYSLGGKWNWVARGGIGVFHGTIPNPLLSCQIPSCGGVAPRPGREAKENAANANTRLYAFASAPFITNQVLLGLLNNGNYPDSQLASDPLPPLPLSNFGFFGDSVIVRFAKDHKLPYGIQGSLGLTFEPVRDTTVDVSYLHVRGVHLGSFYNVNQPPPSCQLQEHDSQGRTGLKNDYHFLPPGTTCDADQPGNPNGLNPGVLPGSLDSKGLPIAVYFEADSKWDSVYDGLLVNVNRRVTHHFGGGLSFTYAKGIDNGPNPSFVLIPQDSANFRAERAVSADYSKARFVGNATVTGPTKMNALVNNWQVSSIVTLEAPHYFTKFAGFDSNGDVFGNNDRVGIEPRNTFKGDSFQTVDLRLSRVFRLGEKLNLEGIAEAFNVLNTVNVRFYNTAYGAADFCPTAGTTVCGPGPYFKEGSPNPNYGTPRAVFNPRQMQLAVRLTW